MNIINLPERELQNLVKDFISDPSKVFKTESGKRLQIISSGTINVNEGPDFSDIAILLDGNLIIGSAEFHKKSSDWKAHNHQIDENYKNVILHIVLNNNEKTDLETLVLNPDNLIQKEMVDPPSEEYIIENFEELQQLSLLRLLRKTAEAQKLINLYGIEQAYINYVKDFLERYNSKKRRPIYKIENYTQILDNLFNSKSGNFLLDLEGNKILIIQDDLAGILTDKIANEGPALRREILLNCLIPFALCLANEESRINLFLWYWSIPAINKYGILTRKFKLFPQNYLWQQQGMLEYMKEYGKKRNFVSDIIRDYGFAEVLSFFIEGKSPYHI